MSRFWKIPLDPQKLEPRVGDTLTRISGQFKRGGVNKAYSSLGMVWVGDRLSFLCWYV